MWWLVCRQYWLDAIELSFWLLHSKLIHIFVEIFFSSIVSVFLLQPIGGLFSLLLEAQLFWRNRKCCLQMFLFVSIVSFLVVCLFSYFGWLVNFCIFRKYCCRIIGRGSLERKFVLKYLRLPLWNGDQIYSALTWSIDNLKGLSLWFQKVKK